MNKTQILGLLRHVLTFGGGLAVGQGWLDESSMVEVIGALVTLAGVAWSMFAPEKKTTT